MNDIQGSFEGSKAFLVLAACRTREQHFLLQTELHDHTYKNVYYPNPDYILIFQNVLKMFSVGVISRAQLGPHNCEKC